MLLRLSRIERRDLANAVDQAGIVEPGDRIPVDRIALGVGKAAREEGMMFLRESALAKVRAGVTTLKEINKVTFIEMTR